jgi:dihydrodipicolinate synthase/N-acetylneuraminate lyase
LWCPPLTHYDEHGDIDAARMGAHLRHLSPYITGFLVPGSTGDGWILSERERRQVLTVALEQAHQFKAHVLVGVLKAKASEAVSQIRKDVAWLKNRTGQRGAEKALLAAHVCGFAVCPPRGRTLGQPAIERALVSVLDLGLPTALYQLPQVTQNELSPAVACELAERFPNFLLFKDSSGADRVVLSGMDLGGVFTMRGGEGDYARWLKTTGGPYDGFLLGSANCFARELHQVMQEIKRGRVEVARELSKRLTAAVGEVMRLVAGLPGGNVFAPANKAIDHFFAYGPRAADVPPPRLHTGGRLPVMVIRATARILARQNLLPAKGYLAG